MRAKRSACLLVVSVCVLLAADAWAQSAASGAIAGEVKDSSGAVVPGVTVEAASPAMIEKVRIAVTDGQGLYRIVDLRPGEYSVTFSLTGFSTVRRQGIILTTAFTARVDAELQLSAVQESITITGATPVVDVQNVRSQNMLTRQVLDTVPTAKNAAGFAILTLGATTGVTGRDVGGNAGDRFGRMSIHGGRTDGVTTFDGLNTHTLKNEGDRRIHSNQIGVQEVAIETAGMGAEAETGGVTINIVPKEGGNRLAGVFNFDWAGRNMQSSNFTDALRSRGLTQPNRLRKIYDVGGGLGGPIKRDRLWFYTSHRVWGAQDEFAGTFYNKVQGSLFYEPDTSRPAYNDYPVEEPFNLRMTWQASPKNKVTFTAIHQTNCVCSLSTGPARAPEASWNGQLVQGLYHASWTFPATNRLLLQGSFMGRDDSGTGVYAEGAGPNDRAIMDVGLGMWYGSVLNGTNPFLYNSDGFLVDYGSQEAHYYLSRFTVSYVTGSNSFKAGFNTQNGYQATGPNAPNFIEAYQFRNRVPVGLWEIGSPSAWRTTMRLNLGIYAQDQWTVKKMTLNLGVRYDSINAYNPAQTRPGGFYIPESSFSEVSNVPNWKDITPRFGVAYDLSGHGKTAIKATLSKYMTATGLRIAQETNPVEAVAGTVFRTWNDSLFGSGDSRTANYLPDCDLKNPLLNGECGQINNLNFGSTVISRRYDPEYLRGWGKRGYSWQGTVTLQHEIAAGMALNVGYYRTWLGNFTVQDNLKVTPADYDSYCISAPVDARLPDGGGYSICDLWDLKPSKLGQVDNLVTAAANFGEQTNVYDGVDIGINARFSKGGLLFGGVSIGRTRTDSCSVVVDSPQNQFCRSSNRQDQAKFAISYPLPWGLQASATFQNLPGVNQLASYVALNAEVLPTLGRNLGACGAAAICNQSTTVSLIAPDQQREPRQNQLDFRLSSVVKLGRNRLQPRLDIYNLLNANDVQTLQTRYGSTWLNASTILSARTIKVGAQFDF